MGRTVHELAAMAEAYDEVCTYCDVMRRQCLQLIDERSREEQDARLDSFDKALGEGRR